MNYLQLIVILCLITGFVSFIYAIWKMIYQQAVLHTIILILNSLLVMIFMYLSLSIFLRGYISNHFPATNGYETMQWMAWCSLLLTLCLQNRFKMLLPFGFLLTGLALLVSMMGQNNPSITQLIPVLSSPLLSIHVVIIMIAYALLSFIMLNGIAGIILFYSGRDCSTAIERLSLISRMILYPAVFFLAIGIFVGAVWANISWGRYWGWDPKEVWALITLLIYAFALHPRSVKMFQKPLFFHVYSIVPFFSVLFTYFGVNFLLGGMHSYA